MGFKTYLPEKKKKKPAAPGNYTIRAVRVNKDSTFTGLTAKTHYKAP